MHEQIGWEVGDARRTPWHQDLPYLPVAGRDLAVLWSCLDAVPRELSQEFVRGSQHGPLSNPTAFNPDDVGAALFDRAQWSPLRDLEAARAEFASVSWAIGRR